MPRETVASFTSLNDLLKSIYRPLADDLLEEITYTDEQGRTRIHVPEPTPGVRNGYVCLSCGAVEFDTNGVCTYCRRQRGP